MITASTYSSMFFLGISIAVIGAAARNIGLTAAQIGLIVSIQNAGFMAGVLVGGLLADRYDKPRIMFWASVILAGAYGFFYRLELFWLNCTVMSMMGVGIGLYEATSDALLLEIHDKNESLHINVNHSFVTLGSLVVTAYLVFLQMSWRRSMTQSAVAVAFLAIIFLIMRAPRATLRESGADAAGLEFLRRPPFLLAFLLLFIAVGSQMAFMGLSTTYLMGLRGHDQVTSKLVSVVFLAGVGFGRVMVGIITRGGRTHGPLTLLFALTSGFSLLFLGADTRALVFPLAALLGLTLSGLLPLSIATVGLVYRARAGAAMGLVKFAIPLGGILIPLLFSGLATVLPLRWAVMVIPTLFGLGFLVALLSGRTLRAAMGHS